MSRISFSSSAGGDTQLRRLRRQSGVIPYRVRDGELEVLLITSRGKGDWIIPKGTVEVAMGEAESALKEAWEEAGVRGRVVGNGSVGSWEYSKYGGVCTVVVYDMEVDAVADAWPERSERDRRWATVTQAADLVKREAVRKLIAGLANRFAKRAAGAGRAGSRG